MTWDFISRHPLTKSNRFSAALRFLNYQVRTRLTSAPVTLPWFGGAKLVVGRKMAGASGNIYCGLHETADMGLLLHLLRPGDLFVDIGANVGSFTVLASKVCGARTVAFEPDPTTVVKMRRNLVANEIEHLVELHQIALTDHTGEVSFTENLDSTNQIIDTGGRVVRCDRLDNVLAGHHPVLIKIDVEGAESQVLRGAPEVLKSASLIAIEVEGFDENVTSVLIEAGFRSMFYNPTTRELTTTPGEISGGNALFVRDVSKVRALVAAACSRMVLPGVSL